MKKIELVVLKLRNFKGIKELDIQLNGGNAEVFGDNAAGKTTLFDAFTWLLFEKDSSDKAKFAIKTLVDGKEVHNLEHSVEATLRIDNVDITLRKVLYEDWVQKQGSPQKTYAGNKTKNYIDGVPIKTQKEYKNRIAEIIDEDTFKLITSPFAFNEQLKWQERRKRLIQIAGNVSDEDVIASNPDLASLPVIIQNRTPENTKDMLVEKQREIKQELQLIPKLVNENLSMKPELTIDVNALTKKVAELESEIDALKTQRHNVLNGAAVLEKQKQLQELDIELSKLKQSFETDSMQEVFKLRARVQESQGNVQIIQGELTQLQNQKAQKESYLNANVNKFDNLKKSREKLVEKWYEINNKTFENEHECPMCKQSLPAEHVQEALAKFNESKSKELAEIDSQGTAIKKELEESTQQQEYLNNEIFHYGMELEKVNEKLDSAQKELSKFTTKLQQAQSAVPDVTKSDGYQSIMSKKQSLLTEIQQLNEHAHEAVSSIDASISELNQQKQSINTEIAQFANIAAIDKRVKELEEKQVKLAKEFEVLEKQIFTIDMFIRTKVKMLDERINSKFKYARFKLFHDQNNGGLEEICETLYEGVPYSQGLNNAARINVGLDIINTLSAHHSVLAPIFIDNAEAVTKLIDSDSQLIALTVSEKDKQLRVEVKDQQPMLKEAI
ncbi:AAA family ATPase [Lysinibacillus sp. FSL K6-3209]|uniref:AAA family ATPase n=1 Tax=Lysinibacillus sp. FSL K6-3209 TaxID=2921497 RepID=UPI0030D8EDF8